MFANDESVFYYIAVMNENYVQPALPKGVEEGILKGMYLLQTGGAGKVRVTLLGSGTILREVHRRGGNPVANDFGIPSDIYSAHQLLRAAPRGARDRALEPAASGRDGAHAVRHAGAVEGHGAVHRGHRLHARLAGHDPRSGCRDVSSRWAPTVSAAPTAAAALRKHFEVDAKNIVYASLHALAEEGALDKGTLKAALNKLGLDPNKLDPQKA